MTIPQLILTGGTISMAKDHSGKLVPYGERLQKLAQKVGFSEPKKPYNIDSIDFNIGVHYPLLRESVVESFQEGKTPVICGGTDSLVWYSTLLTKDLMRQGYLQPGSGQKIIFLSSMKSIEDAPELVEKTLRAGKQVAELPLDGGYALSACTPEGHDFYIHNTLNSLDKVTSKLCDALRSDCPVANVKDGKIYRFEQYQQPVLPVPDGNTSFAHVAPPLLLGENCAAMLAYLQMMGRTEKPFDSIIIEGLPGLSCQLNHSNPQDMVPLVAELKKQGTKVVFCNPVRYRPEHDDMQPVINPQPWQNAPLRKDLEGAGAEFVTALPKDAYLDLMLSPQTARPRSNTDLSANSERLRTLCIRYVPDIATMESALEAITPHASNIVFSALPNETMADAMGSVLQHYRHTHHFKTTFEYNHSLHTDHLGFIIPETPGANPYSAGSHVAAVIRHSDMRQPRLPHTRS